MVLRSKKSPCSQRSIIYKIKFTRYMRMWLSGRASPCQGEGREFESRHPLQFNILQLFEISLALISHWCYNKRNQVMRLQLSWIEQRTSNPCVGGSIPPRRAIYFKQNILYVPLAQLDRASGYGPEGLGFESSMVRHLNLTLAISTFARAFNFFSYEISYDDMKFEKISNLISLQFII